MAATKINTPPKIRTSLTFFIKTANETKHMEPENIMRACNNRIRFTLYLSAPGLFRGLTKRSPLPIRMNIPIARKRTAKKEVKIISISPCARFNG